MIFVLPALLALFLTQENPVFRAGVTLVHVDAAVVSEDNNRILTGLTRDDFQILDNGKPQTVVTFSAGQEPLDLILLFDISASMRTLVERIAAAARLAFQELRPGDRVSVMVFNRRSRVISPFTGDMDAVHATIQQVLGLRFGGGTHIQTAVDDAALRFLHEPRTQRRRAVLIVTDNIGTRTRREQSVVRNFWEADAVLSGLLMAARHIRAVHTISMVMNPYLLPLNSGMKGIAQKTGGDTIQAGDPGTAFQESMHRIRNRYSLYYVPPEGKPGTAHNIAVTLTPEAAASHPRARVHARTGYIQP